MSHIIPVRTQRVVYGFGGALLLTLFSMSVLWRHFDDVFGGGAYLYSVRVAMGFIPFTILFLTGWHIYFKAELPRRWCLWAALILAGIDTLHACNVLALMSAEAEHGREVARKSESAAKIAGRVAEATARANAEAAQKANAAGQKRLASQLANKGAGVNVNEVIVKIGEAEKKPEGTGIFPDWYTRKYSFFVLLLSTLIAFAGALITTDFEDRDGNGVPDWAEKSDPASLKKSHPEVYALMVEKGLVREPAGAFPSHIDPPSKPIEPERTPGK